LAYPVAAPELSEAGSLVSVGSYVVGGVNLGDGTPERLRTATVSPGFFAALGAKPLVGGTFSNDDLKTTDRLAVISHRFWQRRFGFDSTVVGRTITLNGRSFSIVGVMPDRVEFPDATDVWLPVASDPQLASRVAAPAFIARLAPSASASSARQELLALLERRAITRQDARSSSLTVTPLSDALVAEVRPVLLFVVAAGLLVLCVACLNTASLLLTRIRAREREFAVRRAIGASTPRLVRQVCCESLFFAAAAGLVAIPFAGWALDVTRIFIPTGLHGGREIGIDLRALTALGFLSLAVGGLIGLAPSVSAQGQVAGALRVSAATTDDKKWRQLRSVLVTLEIAMAVTILIAAATIVSTVGALMAVDIGPRNDRALVMEITLPRATYSSTAKIRSFYQRLRDELRAVPGLEAAGATNHLPGSTTVITPSLAMALEGQSLPSGRPEGNALRLSATPGYLSALGIDVLAGREFSDPDREEAMPRAIVSEGYARALGLVPHDILGRRVNVALSGVQWAEVVGVVRDVRMRGPESDLQPALYIPLDQTSVSLTGFLAVDARASFHDTASAIRAALARVDSSLPGYNVRAFGDVRSEYLSTRRFTMTAMVAFGSVASGLAVLGLYGILSYLVRLRTREIGIRIALGATAAILQRDVVIAGVRHALAGVGLGLAAALGLWRVVAAHVPGMGLLDAAGVAMVCAVVFMVSIAAAWLPARRAARTDPLVAFRFD
jgi:predicted permease